MGRVVAKCGKCRARWTDPEACHCPRCHRTYLSEATFDAHPCPVSVRVDSAGTPASTVHAASGDGVRRVNRPRGRVDDGRSRAVTSDVWAGQGLT